MTSKLPLPARPNLAFFASRNGSSARSIVEACENGTLNAATKLLIASTPKSGALAWAQQKNLEAHVTEKPETLLPLLQQNDIHLIILSGYMKLLPTDVVQHFVGRILNIHPALLPKYGGQGMYGLNVHKAVIDAGETQSGITIHLVNEKYDDGPIVAQKHIKIDEGETPESLQQEIGSQEPAFFVETLKKILTGEIGLDALS